jgi:hypothetical protein
MHENESTIEYYIHTQLADVKSKSKSLYSNIGNLIDNLRVAQKRLQDLEANIDNKNFKPALLNKLGLVHGEGPRIDAVIGSLCQQYESIIELKTLLDADKTV